MAINLLRPLALNGMSILLDGIPILIADATVSESHKRSANVTVHPREDGSDIADHIQPKAPEIGANLIYSATPLNQTALPGRVESAYRQLLSLQDNRQTVTLVTSLGVYDDMALAEVGAPVSSTTGDALVVDTSWRQVIKVSTQQVAIPAGILRGTIRASGQSKLNTKDQTSTPPEETRAAVRKSVLKGISDAGGGFIVNALGGT